jgi:hypothetical protein
MKVLHTLSILWFYNLKTGIHCNIYAVMKLITLLFIRVYDQLKLLWEKQL